MPLAQPLLVGPEDQRHVRELRHRRAERLVQQHLLRRVRDVIVAADHVGDRHVDVVDDDREVVGRVAVGAQDRRSLRCCAWSNSIGPCTRSAKVVSPSRHAEADRRAARRAASSAAISSGDERADTRGRTSTPRPRASRRRALRLQPLRRAVAVVGVAVRARARRRASRWRSSRSRLEVRARAGRRRPGPSSQSSPSQRRPSRMPVTISADERSTSVSSMRRTNVPPCRRAYSQLNSAVRAPPTCR